jgi:hypothetical protein
LRHGWVALELDRGPPRTLLAALSDKLRDCNVHGDAEEPPVAIL